MSYKKINFTNKRGLNLVGRIDFPIDQKPLTYAVFAHVFTGNKDLLGAKYVSKALVHEGIAVLRFDFTGLGESEGDFSETNFTTNVEDINAAQIFLLKIMRRPL